MPSFTPSVPVSPGVFTPLSTELLRSILFSDAPLLDGSVRIGDLVAGAGFMTPATISSTGSLSAASVPATGSFSAATPPSTGTFTPAS